MTRNKAVTSATAGSADAGERIGSGWLARQWAAIRDWIESGPGRLAAVTAARGMLAVAGPVIVLQFADMPAAGLIAGIGGLQTSIADGGGPYRDRLRSMGLCVLLGPLFLFVGSQVHATWWVAGLLMFLIAAGGGLARALGPIGTVMGLVLSVVFLVGMNIHAPPLQGLLQAGFYLGGALWTLLIALVLWRLRPYKRLEMEVGAALLEVTRLIATVPLRRPRVRRLRERDLRRRERSLREAMERARYTLGQSRELSARGDPTISRLLVLLRTASRLAFTAGRLHELRLPPGSPAALQKTLAAAINELGTASRRCTIVLTGGRGEIDIERLDQRIDALRQLELQGTAEQALRNHTVAVLELGAQHLRNARETLRELSDRDHRLRGRLLPPLTGERPASVLRRLRPHLTLRSIMFRHALRVGTAAGLATALFSALRLPHGIWLPLTIIVVLQPQFGATLSRALLRTIGTLIGVLVAGVLLLALPNVAAVDVVIALLSFLAFAAFRRSYALFIVCVTPLVVLLLDLLEPARWSLAVYRAADTLAGAALALFAGYALWPRWTHTELPEQMARALRAEAEYLRHTLAATAKGEGLTAAVLAARRSAEIEAGNADATFERMLSEPRRRATESNFAVVTYLQRLSRHLGAVAARLEAGTPAAPELGRLITPLSAVLEEAAKEITRRGVGTTSLTPELYEEVLTALRTRDQNSGADLARPVGFIISDVSTLRDAVRRGSVGSRP